MRKKAYLIVLLVLMCFLSSCSCRHEWMAASCEVPKTCTICHATEGEKLKHDWMNGDCENPRTCKLCGKEQGEALGHEFDKWKMLDDETMYHTCSRCDTIKKQKVDRAAVLDEKLPGTWDTVHYLWEDATTEYIDCCYTFLSDHTFIWSHTNGNNYKGTWKFVDYRYGENVGDVYKVTLTSDEYGDEVVFFMEEETAREGVIPKVLEIGSDGKGYIYQRIDSVPVMKEQKNEAAPKMETKIEAPKQTEGIDAFRLSSNEFVFALLEELAELAGSEPGTEYDIVRVEKEDYYIHVIRKNEVEIAFVVFADSSSVPIYGEKDLEETPVGEVSISLPAYKTNPEATMEILAKIIQQCDHALNNQETVELLYVLSKVAADDEHFDENEQWRGIENNGITYWIDKLDENGLVIQFTGK